jgi:hypothetical protein
MSTQVHERTQNGTTKCHSTTAFRQIQPPPDSQTQRTSTDGSQSDGAQISQEIPAITSNGKELRVRVRLASATSSASTDAAAETAMVLRLKPSKVYGEGNPTRVGKGSWRARAEEIDFSSSAAIEKAIPSYTGKKYGQLAFPLSLLVDVKGNVNPDKIWCYQQVTKWRKMSPADQKKEFDFQKGIDYHCGKIGEVEKKKAKTDKKRNANKRKKRAQKKQSGALMEVAEAVPVS